MPEPVTEYTSALGTLNVQNKSLASESVRRAGCRRVELASAVRSVSGGGKTGYGW